MKIYNYQLSSPKQPKQKLSKTKRTTKALTSKKFWTWVFRVIAFGIFAIALLFLYYAKDLPDPNNLLNRDIPQSTKIFARDGSLLYEIHGEYKRTLVNLNQIASTVPEATIAIEDKNFYHEGGIAPTSIIRAIITDVLTLHKSQGASTITQQLVKNAILTDTKSWDRKIKEVILAMSIDARFSKDQILQMYLNEIPYGRNAYGIEAAAQTYFGKSAKDLDLAESAYLAALPQAPTYYSPTGPNRQALDDRKNIILNQMQQQGYITKDQLQQAESEKVAFLDISNSIIAPHFVMMIQNYLATKYGEKTLEEGGLQVYTTLDPKLQGIAEDAVKTGVDKYSKKYNAHNAGLVAIDPKTGQILAMVGSKDYFGTPEPTGCTPGKNCEFEPNVNVTLAQRQPGSSFKPYVYITAFSKPFDYSPATMLMDVVTDFGTYAGKDYIPRNYNEKEYGPVSMRQALAGSLNVPAVKTLDLVGVDNAVQTAHTLGITSPLSDCGLSLVLGGCEVRLLDHVAAFSVFANAGVKHDSTAILKIVDKDGNVLEQYTDNSQQVADPQAVYELVNVLSDNNARSFIFGPNSPLTLPDRPVAAKTGTTQNFHDGWTLGFTPSLVAGVWAGNNDGTLLTQGADGVVVAAPIWHQFMEEALKGTPVEAFPVPPQIEKITVDSLSGKLPTQFTPQTKEEVFADYSAPTQYDDAHISVAIDSSTNLPASATTPASNIIYKTYTVLHSEKPQDPNWENPVIAWALANGYSYPPGGSAFLPPTGGNNNKPTVNIVEPNDNANIFQLPFIVSASAASTNQINRVDLSIDGQLIQTLTGAPYTFTVNKNLPDGSHILAVRATDSQGNFSDTSITVNYSINSPLTIIDPSAQTQLNFPLTLTAESGQNFPYVNFYYQSDNGATQLIGASTNTSSLGNKYDYTLTWGTSPKSGNYRIYAQTPSGINSPKIKVTTP